MKLEHTGIEGQVVDFSLLTEAMKENGFVHAGQWDYERITYDYKFEVLEDIYYLRLRGYAVEGDIGSRKAKIQLLTPLLGKHYYPHGVEYGDGETFPESVVKKSKQLLQNVADALAALPNID
ncbi:YugN family protein [Ectobacillus ponti]|uniref:YugN-like family protein n=1 Tax=Ectobacillus ponti TaxID=2961894 RepID=A0AA42BU83_9BACI|nr:YugN family protein [Ectobacillus ponti]MCP8970273.1 YugN-like family protein [Ectobacillus ponti]